jgi:tRNA (guanine-N7-)-methyltransferase
VRTFHARRGRMTTAQRVQLGDLLERYGVPNGLIASPDLPLQPLDLAELGGGRPVVLEIGFGMGAATLTMAMADPTRTILAVDVHTPGVLRLLRGVSAHELSNVVVAHEDAIELIKLRVPSCSLAGIRIFFPDPWPKVRHHKRRMVQPDVVALLAGKLISGGTLHLATDIAGYAHQMLAVCSAEPLLNNMFSDLCIQNCDATLQQDTYSVLRSGFAPGRIDRPATKFEIQGEQQGRPSYDMVFQR